jgi:hypothetical protein
LLLAFGEVENYSGQCMMEQISHLMAGRNYIEREESPVFQYLFQDIPSMIQLPYTSPYFLKVLPSFNSVIGYRQVFSI